MKVSSISGALYASALLVATLTFTLGTAQASIVTVTNGTTTILQVDTGEIEFDWDLNSQYDIVGTEVILKTNEIVTNENVVGTLYEFVIPNFFDPLPKKTVQVEMQGASGESVARVLDIIGSDSDFFNPGPSVPVDGIFVSSTVGDTLVTELWEMFPNPDFEIVKIFAPTGFNLQSITIHTQSLVPIPAAVWLFGSGLLGLVAIARRKKAA